MNTLKYKEFHLVPLTKALVEKYSAEICQALNQIPLVGPYTLERVTAESKGDRIFYKLWEHGLLALKGDDFAGIVMGYERKAEGNEQYPHHSIYMSEFAVAQQYQKHGLGKFLVKAWLDFNRTKGFLELAGPLQFSLQTNSADWNLHVQKLYESFGFQKTATKTYDNRVDNVYFLEG